jgi:hypothetical protein
VALAILSAILRLTACSVRSAALMYSCNTFLSKEAKECRLCFKLKQVELGHGLQRKKLAYNLSILAMKKFLKKVGLLNTLPHI